MQKATIKKGAYIIEEVQQKTDEFAKKVAEMDGQNPEEELPKLAEELLLDSVISDYVWVVEKDGRPRGIDDRGTSSKPTSRYLSQVVFYGIMGKPTRYEVYDQMFKDMMDNVEKNWHTPILIEYPEREEIKGQKEMEISLGEALMATARVHLSHYPNDKDRLPQEWRDIFQLFEGEDDHKMKQDISTIRGLLEEPNLRTSKSELFPPNSGENFFGKIT